MTPTVAVFTVFGLTLVSSLVLPRWVKPLLVKLGIVDVPTERSSHERPVLRGLGLAVLIAMMIGMLAGVFWALVWGRQEGADLRPLAVIGAVALASGLTGLGEDLRGLSVKVRSFLLLLIGGASAFVLVWPFGSTGSATFGWGFEFERTQMPAWLLVLLVIYGTLFLSSYVNVANFMDGLNGISGFHGVVAGVTFAAIGHVTELTWLGVAGVALAAAYLGFLPFNLSKPGAFLGDVGSYLLGGATAATSFAAVMAGVPLLATIGPMVIYFGDVGVTLVRRVRRGHKWDEPHKEHVYQRINQLGYSHAAASALAAVCAVLTSALGFASLYVEGPGQTLLLVGGFMVLGLYLALPRLLPSKP